MMNNKIQKIAYFLTFIIFGSASGFSLWMFTNALLFEKSAIGWMALLWPFTLLIIFLTISSVYLTILSWKKLSGPNLEAKITEARDSSQKKPFAELSPLVKFGIGLFVLMLLSGFVIQFFGF